MCFLLYQIDARRRKHLFPQERSKRVFPYFFTAGADAARGGTAPPASPLTAGLAAGLAVADPEPEPGAGAGAGGLGAKLAEASAAPKSSTAFASTAAVGAGAAAASTSASATAAGAGEATATATATVFAGSNTSGFPSFPRTISGFGFRLT